MSRPVQMSRVVAICVGLALALCLVACPKRVDRTPSMPPPAVKARIDALIDSALQLKENKVECVPYETHKQAVLVSIDIWETYAICVVDREELIQLASIDKAELQGQVNAQAARADKNARWIWIVAGIGAALTVVGFGIGAAAF